MKILVNFATRSRPEKFLKAINRLNATAHNLDILVKADLDDETMIGIEDKLECDNVRFAWGYSDSKIHAINRDITGDFDILVNFSDDMWPVKVGWDDDLRLVYGLEGLKLAAHYSDGTDVRDRLITYSIMGRELYDFLGYVYHPSYISLWCDNEFGDVSKILGVYKYLGGVTHKNVLWKHKHPAWDKDAATDEQYKRTESFYRRDEMNYLQRKADNFGITPELIRSFNG